MKFSTEGYTREDIKEIKKLIEDGNIRDQNSFDKWAKSHLDQQRSDNSDSIVAEDRAANENNDRLHLQTSEGESLGRHGHQNSQEDFGTDFIKVRDNDGTNGPRYIPVNTQEDSIQTFSTPEGEVYGFVDKDGNIYLDEDVISPEHPIHEYTHMWDRYVQKHNKALWKRGVELMKQISLWNNIMQDDNYGKKWKSMQGMTQERLENLVASEVHARLVGQQGEQMLMKLSKEKGNASIVSKLKAWILALSA